VRAERPRARRRTPPASSTDHGRPRRPSPGPPHGAPDSRIEACAAYKMSRQASSRVCTFCRLPRALRRAAIEPPPSACDPGLPTTLGSPRDSIEARATAHCSARCASRRDYSPQRPSPPRTVAHPRRSRPRPRICHQPNLRESNRTLVPLVCLGGLHIAVGEPPPPPEGIDVRKFAPRAWL
jgi:hypothetical protein